ncbi:hypothetical protein BDQ17DRAFT_1368377 [Cyathus striatus]|nr:hypothetical protein BDQ17DRAFT_1368377 [Cyathus striatus]
MMLDIKKFTSIPVIFISLSLSFSVTAQQDISCGAPGGNGEIGNCQQFINTFCSDISQSQFDNGDLGSRCFNTNGMHCDFSAFNTLNTGVGSPSKDNCGNVLLTIANNCDSGGQGKETSTSRFTFSVQSISGTCF